MKGQQSGSWPKQTKFSRVDVPCLCLSRLWRLHKVTHAMNSHAEHIGSRIATDRFSRECCETILRTIANECRHDKLIG